MSYLATHPRRGFRPGDEVIHVGEGISYRGRLGRVVSVHGSKANGYIKVMWDHKMTAMEYSIHWALCKLAVHINCLRQQYHDFDGRKYAAKYMHYGFSGGEVIKGFAMTPHQTMKEQTDAKLSIEKPEVCEPRKDITFPAFVENRTKGTITRVSSEAMLQRLGEGTYTVYSKVGNINVKPVAQKEITFM